jgi:asparagine synthase (glutamine-hydrolysing)
MPAADYLGAAEAGLRTTLQETWDLDPINRVSYLEARCYMLNTLLRDSDFMSMAHGLEIRVPLIDHRLANKAMQIPGSWKREAGTPKPLLVHALNGALPDSIVHRKKRGFTLPFEHWMKDSLRSEMERSCQSMAEGPLQNAINPSAAKQVWQDFLHGRTSWSRPWSLFVLQQWCVQNL